jgi:sigma-B regulation protein RsbU (phosphoserine phosphatase)
MMSGSISPGMFVTAVVCFYDPAARAATFADAGHNPPVIRRASGSVEFLELPKGFPLGVVDEGQYSDSGLALKAGDTVLFYTDGVTDAEDQAGRLFGAERLAAALQSARPGAKGTVEAVLSAVHDFVGLTRPFDDITMIAVSPR